MLVDVPFMVMMKVPVMQIIGVPFVIDRLVPAVGTVLVRMLVVYVATGHMYASDKFFYR